MSDGRISKEIAELKRDKTSGVTIEQDPSNPKHLTGTIRGPDDTPYSGGVFTIDINVPPEYPFSPPKMKFLTKVWHPNISSVTGAICLDILKDQWSPALTLKTALLSLQALLCAPEPGDPQDAEVANMYLGNNAQFVSTARFWTDCYAMSKDKPADGSLSASVTSNPSVMRLMDMGFSAEDATRALLECKGDETSAVEKLLS